MFIILNLMALVLSIILAYIYIKEDEKTPILLNLMIILLVLLMIANIIIIVLK